MMSVVRRALVIEDDRSIARAVADQLSDEGFQVDEAYDGDSGFLLGTQGDYDIVVLDIMLPKRNGFQVCSDLRDAGVSTPILMLTAKEGELDEAEGLDVGADDFLRKPFERVVFIARVHALLRRRDRERPPTLHVGEIFLDPVAHSVKRGEESLALTPREFSLLNHLMSNAGRSVAKSEILEAVWGSEFDGDPNIIEVYIGYLRRKLDEVGSESVIRTVRGVGYTMTAAR